MVVRPDASGGFRIHRISFHGVAGAIVAVYAIAVLLEGVPTVRWPFLASLIAGCLVGAGLVPYRRRR